MGAAEVGGNRKRSFPLGFFFHDLIKALFGWFFKMVENIFEQTFFNFLRIRQNRDFSLSKKSNRLLSDSFHGMV
jgi:hypothetical protein